MTAEAEMANQPDREQARESINTMRVIGGLLLIVALLLYFFHLAEAPDGALDAGRAGRGVCGGGRGAARGWGRAGCARCGNDAKTTRERVKLRNRS